MPENEKPMCKSCLFFDSIVSLCYRFPPVWVGRECGWLIPPVHSTFWCGEYKENPPQEKPTAGNDM